MTVAMPRTGEKLSVLLAVHQFFPAHRTGTEVLTLELARGLRDRGHRVRIAAGVPETDRRAADPAWATEDVYDGFPAYRLHYGCAPGGDTVTPDFRAPKRVRMLCDAVSGWKPDIVHFTHLKGFSAQAVPALAADGSPVIFTPTDYWTLCPKTMLIRKDGAPCDGPSDPAVCLECLRPLPRPLARFLLAAGRTPLRFLGGRMAGIESLSRRAAEMARCVNAATAILPATRFLGDLLARNGVAPDKIRVVGYGVRLGELPPPAPIGDRFEEESPLRVGFIGTLSELKGAHVLLESAELLPERQRASFEIFGAVDPEDRYCRSLLERASRIGPSVRFRGTFPHERIGEVLRGLHVLVVPSLWYESTPLVLCSALGAGTPVLVSRLGGMTEVLEEGRNGFSFPAGDSGALAERIRRFLDRPAELQMMRDRFPVRVRTVEQYVEDVEAEYFRALRKMRA